jgi:hypothetical protein
LATETIHDYDFHPPDDVRLFPMPKPGVLHLDDRIFVAVSAMATSSCGITPSLTGGSRSTPPPTCTAA